MNLDLGSFAFGSYLDTGAGTPSWGTSLGQSKPDYKFTYPGSEVLLIGMVYCSVPLDYVSLPIGKGGHIYQASEFKGCQVASLFRKVYINGTRVNYPFIMVLVKENSDSHSGRKTIKYSDKNSYKSTNEQFSNVEFIRQARISLGMSEKSCWFVYAIEVYNQDELHMFAVIVDKENSITYSNSSVRRNAWIDLIQNNEIPHIDKSKSILGHQEPLQQIFYGAPGTGKSNIIKKLVDEQNKRCHRITFHPDSDYSTFVGAYKPTMKVSSITKDGVTTKEEKIVYKFCPQAFTNAYVEAWNTEEEVYLIIEEINRGNCAQIFGDLFQLLDRKNGVSEYPVDADADLAAYIRKELEDSPRQDIPQCIKEGKKLMLPSNLYIWATMNTSDQSLFPIDSAFKRRWEWKYMKIKKGKDELGNELNWKIAIKDNDGNLVKINGEDSLPWWNFIEKINEIIASMTSSADKQLGYFFCKADNEGEIPADKFVSKVIFYLWNDVFKDYGFEDAYLFQYTVKDSDGKDTEKDLTFPDFYEEDGENINTERLADFLTKVMNWKKTAEDNN